MNSKYAIEFTASGVVSEAVEVTDNDEITKEGEE
jgi:hypothetical protein